MDTKDRRQDYDSAEKIKQALQMQEAFGFDVAQRFLKLRGIGDEVAQRTLIGKYEQRQRERRDLANRPAAA
ncbi:MAG: hypothetical protein V4508_02595 [Pseudomonadota bacterium]